MNKSILHSAITAAMVLSITACSSGGSDVAGIGGSGITSSGTITGFGSVYVNGVKYDTSGSTITIDDNPGIESDLAVGMRVTVSGSLIDDSNGTATSISFNDDLEGPVSNIADVGNDGLIKTFNTLGRQVRISSDTTSFDVSGAAAGNTFDFDNILNDDHVEISGFLDSNNVMVATRVELKARPFNVSSIVEIKGTIENVNTTLETFNLVGASATTINYSGAIIDNNLLGGVVNGAFVEVKGQCTSTLCATVNASKVESGFDDFNDNDDVEYEGLVTSVTNSNTFEVNGIPVDASSATRIPTSFTPVLNQEVEVEGNFNGTTLVATKVKDESNDIKVEDTIFDVDPANNSFRLEPVESSGQFITVIMDKSTEVEDEVGGITNPDDLINSLSSGQFVSVEGFDGGTGTIIASEVEREASVDDVIVQGIITARDTVTTDVTVLGVTIPYNVNTEFENENDIEFPTAADFFGAVQLDTTLVKVKDRTDDKNNGPGIADEIEIELP